MSYKITTKISWAQTISELREEFKRWGVSEWDINNPRGMRLTSWYQSEDDRTVILSYMKNGKEIVLSYGKQNRAVDNLRALYLTVNDMRMAETRGISDLMQSAYKQLGSGGADHVITKSPYEILGILPNSPLETAEAVYRSLATKYHPDSKPDGDTERFKLIAKSIEEIRSLHK